MSTAQLSVFFCACLNVCLSVVFILCSIFVMLDADRKTSVFPRNVQYSNTFYEIRTYSFLYENTNMGKHVIN